MDYSQKTVTVLGSTGSVGTQALDVICELGLRVRLLSGYKNVERLAEQIGIFSPESVNVADEDHAKKLRDLIGGKETQITFGTDALIDSINEYKSDITVHSISGLAGIPAALAASRSSTRLAMANKEAIITAGDIIFNNLSEYGGSLVPVDSEHSAIFQCLAENASRTERGAASSHNVSRILLTASGGPFFGWTPDELRKVTPQMALAHPTWKMGPKITIDSATLMNKGFEIIEAVRLFGVTHEQVKVVVHRQSIIHSMVEYIDNTVIAQLGAPDMRSAVRYAVTYPERAKVANPPLDFAALSKLTFDDPDPWSFPLLDAGRTAYDMGGTALCTLIAADEAAVEAFLAEKIGFGDIPRLVFDTLEKAEIYEVTPETLDASGTEAKAICRSLIRNL